MSGCLVLWNLRARNTLFIDFATRGKEALIQMSKKKGNEDFVKEGR
jgi:hypothetical protein